MSGPQIVQDGKWVDAPMYELPKSRGFLNKCAGFVVGMWLLIVRRWDDDRIEQYFYDKRKAA